MKTPVEAQHAKARTVVQGGVLKGPASCDLHELHIDLNRLSGLRLLEELHLPGHALARASQARQPDVTEDPLNRAHGEPDPVPALEPQPGARGPVAELLAGLADQLDSRRRHAPGPVPGIRRYQPLEAAAPPASSPPPNRADADPIVPASGRGPMLARVLEHEQPIAHPRPILRPDLHVAELDHWAPHEGCVWRGTRFSSSICDACHFAAPRSDVPVGGRYLHPSRRSPACGGIAGVARHSSYKLRPNTGTFFDSSVSCPKFSLRSGAHICCKGRPSCLAKRGGQSSVDTSIQWARLDKPGARDVSSGPRRGSARTSRGG